MRASSAIGLTTLAFLVVATATTAQVVRESDASSIAGVLAGPAAKVYDDFSFTSGGSEVLYASVDAAVYQTQGSAHHDDVAVEAEPGGGCSGEDAGGVALCLQVLDDADQLKCWATRPKSPGWQKDPRLICLLPEVKGQPAQYRLRVSLADEECGDLIYPIADAADAPYLLNLSLRRVATPGPIAPAVAQSKNLY